MKKVKLGEVATFINGYAFKPQDWSTEGKEIIRIQNLTKTSKEINYYSGKIDKKYIVETGDILISWSGTIGVFQWYGKTAVLNQHIFKVVFDKLDLDRSYFKYVVEKGLQDALKNTHGSTMKHLTKKYFDNIVVSYTSFKEQQRISSKLDLLSNLILMRQEQLEELNLLVKSRFNEMFGDPVLNEMGWDKCRLKDISEEKLAYGSGASAIEFSGLRYIRITDIDTCGNLKPEKKSPSQFDEKYLLNTGDILFARSGATVGKTFLYSKKKHGPALYAGYLIRLIPNHSLVNPIFVYHFTKTKYYNDFIAKVQNAVAQPNINAKQYSELDFILPPLSLQNEFADFVAQVDKSQLAIQKSLEELETLKKSLMQEYFG